MTVVVNRGITSYEHHARSATGLQGHEGTAKMSGKLFSKGASQAEIARELEVFRQSVSASHKAWSSGGTAALNGAGRAGR